MAFISQDPIMGTVDLSLVDTNGPGASAYRFTYPSQFVDGVDTVLGGGVFAFAKVAAITAQTISSITISSNTATLTTGSAHGLGVGATINISGALPIGYNGQFVVATVPSSTTLTFDASKVVDTRVQQIVANPNTPSGNATQVGTYVGGLGAGQVVQFTHAQDSSGNLLLQVQAWAGTANSGFSLGAMISYPLAGQWAWVQVGGAMVVYCGGSPAATNQAYYSSTGLVQPSAVASKQMTGVQFASANGVTLGSGTQQRVLPSNQAVIWGTYPAAQGAIT